MGNRHAVFSVTKWTLDVLSIENRKKIEPTSGYGSQT